VHDWALGQFVPIQYLGVDGARLAADHAVNLGAKCDIVVVFEARRGKGMDTVIRKLRACKTTQVELDLFAPPERALLG
jgi:hypothetical protein